MQLPIVTKEGTQTGKHASFDDAVFGITPNNHCIYLDIRLLDANQRQGTHKTKERGEVSGTTRKPFKQKGTGGARQGHMRAPHHRHGGTVFGPRPRDYSFKINAKMRNLARLSAFVHKLNSQDVVVVDSLTLDEIKTKKFLNLLEALQLSDQKAIFVTSKKEENLYLSARNYGKAEVVHATQLNTKQILHAQRVILDAESVNILNSRFNSRA